MVNLDVNLRLPAFFTTTLVVEAFDGTKSYWGVIRQLRKLGIIEDATSKPMLCDPQILRDELPSIYHRCVELILEKRMRGEKMVRSKKGNLPRKTRAQES